MEAFIMKNGVIYARYSCDKQTENSILGQVRECEEFAKKNDINVICVYKDEAKSGRDTKHRHDFMKMIRDAENRLFDYIIVWKGDRFSRSRADSARYKSELKKLGIRVLSATEANVTGPEAVLMDGINEAFAEYFSVELAAKVERGMTQNAIEGKFNGGTMTFGYKLDEDRKIVIDEYEANIIREIFTKYAMEDVSIADVNRMTVARCFTRKDGSKISVTSINSFLRNKRYIGIYEFKGTVNDKMFPPIVDVATFEKVQAKLAKNKKIGGKYRTRDTYLLTGKLICADCGQYMTSYAGTGKHGKLRKFYRCAGTKVENNCDHKPARKEFIEDEVFSVVSSVLNDDKVIDLIVAQLQKYQAKENPDIERYKKEAAELDKKIERLLVIASEGIDFDIALNKLKEFKELRAELDRQIKIASVNAKMYSPEILKAVLKRMSKEKIETLEGKKKIIAMLVNKIYLNKAGNIQVVFNVLNDSVPVIRESWCQVLQGSVHQWRITQGVEGAGLENR